MHLWECAVVLRRSANKAREGGSMLIRFLESTFFLKICKQARSGREMRVAEAGLHSCNLL